MECVEVVELCDSGDQNMDQTEALDVMVLKTCGQLMFDLFERIGNNDVTSTGGDSCNDTISSTATSDDSWSSTSSVGDTYHDRLMDRAFDRIYDVMSQDLEKVDPYYQTPPKLQLYHKLYNFVRHYKLHQINRYVFGNEPHQDWGPDATDALTTVRTWRLKFVDGTKVVDGLMEAYKMAAANKELHSYEVAMVAFAVFSFLLGYDGTIDYDILFMFRHIEDIYELQTFQHVHNSVLRHARLFLEGHASDEDETFFESLAENADIVAVFNWIFDLLAERPEAIDKFTDNPFQSVECQIDDVNGKKISPSYVIKLRVFYRWVLMELFVVLSGRLRDRMSLLDFHVKQCLCCLSETSWLQLFENVYVYALKHFTTILSEYNCPKHMLKTFRDMFSNETLKDLIRFCVSKQVADNTYLNHRDSSTDSNESLGSSES
ncbi:unnamed protein product [Macrosiphum euphorbiae]|uniref:Uncharacterized protein n=1 Tax=Macrosiphum euphorbiae TaxID=13131 RepID=A0AAV0WBY2_9HEMI|nr:unnamed protein product [Macrosiphum euphorbiae]